jgi:hypothetical protein
MRVIASLDQGTPEFHRTQVDIEALFTTLNEQNNAAEAIPAPLTSTRYGSLDITPAPLGSYERLHLMKTTCVLVNPKRYLHTNVGHIHVLVEYSTVSTFTASAISLHLNHSSVTDPTNCYQLIRDLS